MRVGQQRGAGQPQPEERLHPQTPRPEADSYQTRGVPGSDQHRPAGRRGESGAVLLAGSASTRGLHSVIGTRKHHDTSPSQNYYLYVYSICLQLLYQKAQCPGCLNSANKLTESCLQIDVGKEDKATLVNMVQPCQIQCSVPSELSMRHNQPIDHLNRVAITTCYILRLYGIKLPNQTNNSFHCCIRDRVE